LTINNRVGREGLPGTNTLANYKHSLITGAKHFIILSPGANEIKLFMALRYEFSQLARMCPWQAFQAQSNVCW
jgi:hypothetical protein